jgi:hypothetical protein
MLPPIQALLGDGAQNAIAQRHTALRSWLTLMPRTGRSGVMNRAASLADGQQAGAQMPAGDGAFGQVTPEDEKKEEIADQADEHMPEQRQGAGMNMPIRWPVKKGTPALVDHHQDMITTIRPMATCRLYFSLRSRRNKPTRNPTSSGMAHRKRTKNWKTASKTYF